MIDPWGDLWGWSGAKNQLFSEYGHVAYQIKGNKGYNKPLANILYLNIPVTHGMGSKGHFLVFESSHVAHQTNGRTKNTMQVNRGVPAYTQSTQLRTLIFECPKNKNVLNREKCNKNMPHPG